MMCLLVVTVIVFESLHQCAEEPWVFLVLPWWPPTDFEAGGLLGVLTVVATVRRTSVWAGA